MRRIVLFTALGLILASALNACSTADLAAQSVENYYQALVQKDVDRALALSCADWELNAQMEVDSFQAVDARLDGFACQQTGTDGEMTLVSCQGQILMTYDGEAQSLDLSGQTFQVLEQGGDFLFCGYR